MTPASATQVTISAPRAESIDLFVCSDNHIHFLMCDEKSNPITGMIFDPEEALAIAKKIEHAADVALGLA